MRPVAWIVFHLCFFMRHRETVYGPVISFMFSNIGGEVTFTLCVSRAPSVHFSREIYDLFPFEFLHICCNSLYFRTAGTILITQPLPLLLLCATILELIRISELKSKLLHYTLINNIFTIFLQFNQVLLICLLPDNNVNDLIVYRFLDLNFIA